MINDSLVLARDYLANVPDKSRRLAMKDSVVTGHELSHTTILRVRLE